MSGQTLNIYVYIYIFCDILLKIDVRGSVINEVYLFFINLFIKQFWDKLGGLVSEVSFIRGVAAGVDYFLSTHFSPIEDNILFEENIFSF